MMFHEIVYLSASKVYVLDRLNCNLLQIPAKNNWTTSLTLLRAGKNRFLGLSGHYRVVMDILFKSKHKLGCGFLLKIFRIVPAVAGSSLLAWSFNALGYKG